MTTTVEVAADIEVAVVEDSTVLSKQDIVNSVAAEFGITKKLAKELVSSVLNNIGRAVLAEGKEFRFQGIGTLKRVDLEACEARNPQTGATVTVGKRYKVRLKNKPVAAE